MTHEADAKEIKELFGWGVLSGVTTNPLIIAKEAPDADLGERIREVLAVSWGDVSVELTTETEKEMLEESLLYVAWDPARITVKVPFSETGLRVSTLCLGMMSYGKHESRPWTLDETEAAPVFRP